MEQTISPITFLMFGTLLSFSLIGCVEVVGPGEWVTVRAGTFTMGSPPDEGGRSDDETQHEVTLTRDFEILSTEVTQDEFEALLGYNPSYFETCGGTCPVEEVNWHEAAAYCNALSGEAGLERCYSCSGSGPDVTCEPMGSSYAYECQGYRLPITAEWEYAARSGTSGAQYGDLDDVAWYAGNSGGHTHAVGTRDASQWGFYDMLGNVSEWCGDWWEHSERMVRGGSYQHFARGTRAANRYGEAPGDRKNHIGFRPVRTLPAP